MQGQPLKLPPWSRKKRIITTFILTCFILLASGCIGVGWYQTGVQAGWITPAMTKKSLLLSLLNDAQFIRAVRHTAQLRDCINYEQAFRFQYEAPLHLTEVKHAGDNCTLLVTTHPTGATIAVQVTKEPTPRETLSLSRSQEFATVQTDFLSGTPYETSVLSGIRNGTLTTIYIMGVTAETSWVVTYTPTTPVVDGKVLELVESFRVF